MKQVMKVLGGKKDPKVFEAFLREDQKATDLFIEHFSPYNADMVGYLRWATTDSTGRLARYFQKQTETGSKLAPDRDGEFISTIWYKLFLKNREHYLTERVWNYMINKRNRQCIIINLDGIKRPASHRSFAKFRVFTFPSTFLYNLDKNASIRKHLILEAQNIKSKLKTSTGKTQESQMGKKLLTELIMRKVRDAQVNQDLFSWQQRGIKYALAQWIEEEGLGKELSKCFKLLYGNETHDSPILNFEPASQFLFMFQNLAVFCPEVKVVCLFAYTSATKNPTKRSSVTFFFKEARDHQALISCSDKIFAFLADIESVPNKTNQKEYHIQDYPLWINAFDRLP